MLVPERPNWGARVRFETRDVFAEPWEGPFDVVMCSLFLHHLEEERAIELLAPDGPGRPAVGRGE